MSIILMFYNKPVPHYVQYLWHLSKSRMGDIQNIYKQGCHRH